MTLQRPNLHRRGGYKRGVASPDVVSISNMALKFKLGKECQALSAVLTILSRACLQQTRAPKHVVQLFTLTRSYFIAFELHFLGGLWNSMVQFLIQS